MQVTTLHQGTQSVIDLINRDNGTSFTRDSVTLSKPFPLNFGDRNTGCRVWDNVKSIGATVRYNRLDIDQTFKIMWGDDRLLQLDISNYSSLSEMIDIINNAYSLQLLASDVVDVVFDKQEPFVVTPLIVTPHCHLYTGTLAMQLFNIDLSTVRITSDGRLRLVDNDLRHIS